MLMTQEQADQVVGQVQAIDWMKLVQLFKTLLTIFLPLLVKKPDAPAA